MTRDDELDIEELTKKLNKSINEILVGQDNNIAISSLFGSFVNALFNQIDDEESLKIYKKIFNQVYDRALERRFNNKSYT